MTTAVTATAAIGVIAWFVQPRDFVDKVLVFVGLVGVIAATILVPYLYRLVSYVQGAVSAFEGIPAQINAVRIATWRAVQTNATFDGYPIDIQRLKLHEGFVLFLIDIGEYEGVESDMQFEIVAVPDMEVYGVIRAFQVKEESTWCVLDESEGRSEFATQMRDRLAGGDITPPGGYEVRPFMAAAYQYVMAQVGPATTAANDPPVATGWNLVHESILNALEDDEGSTETSE